jgi:hypothetical protein
MNVFKLSYKKLLGLGGLGIRKIRVWGIRAPKKLLGLGGLGIRGIRVPMNYLNCRIRSC